MPMSWIEPETLTTHRGVAIYHTYKNDSADDRMTYWYTTDIIDGEDFTFDVRELPVPEGVEPENHALVIANAIDKGLIDLADDVEIEDPLMQVRADIRSESHHGEVEFDASAWMDQASSETIAALQATGWCEKALTSEIARWMDIRDYRIAAYLHQARATCPACDLSDLEVVLKKEDAETYLDAHHPDKYGKALHLNRLAVKVTGVVNETITIRKEVTDYLPIPEAEFQAHLKDGEAGEVNEMALIDLQKDAAFDEKLASFLRERAYEQLVTGDEDHGWEVTGSEGPVIDQVELHEFE